MSRFFFFNDTATTEIYTSFPTRRSSDLCLDRECDGSDHTEQRQNRQCYRGGRLARLPPARRIGGLATRTYQLVKVPAGAEYRKIRVRQPLFGFAQGSISQETCGSSSQPHPFSSFQLQPADGGHALPLRVQQ